MAETATFNFAWVLSTETTFVAATHAVQDESVFGLEIAQNEGEFATASIQIRRPTAGLLNSSRKQYAWISVTQGATSTALFFGRVLGLPRDLAGDVVTLEFVSQFPSWESSLDTLFATLKVLPFWDEALIAAADQNKPDTALESRRALYNFDRVSGAVTLSDLIVGDSTTTVSDHYHDSLVFDVTGNPARRVTVRARVEWEQRITGQTRKVNTKIKKAFGGTVNSFTPDAMLNGWPEPGVNIGGQSGYNVIKATIRQISPLPAEMSAASSSYAKKISDAESGYAAAVLGTSATSRSATVPRVWFETDLKIGFDFRQSRTETISVEIQNDVQLVAFAGTDGGSIDIELTAEDVIQAGLMTPSYSSYFLTTRGKRSFGYMLARAQAALAASARSVEITIERPFFSCLSLSCKDALTVTDSRLPGGTATGKIKAYKLTVDGSTGETKASVTLGVSVGNGATYSASGTAGEYCTTQYIGGDYQEVTGQDVDPDITSIIFDSYSGQKPSDPSIIAKLGSHNIVDSITLTNGPTTQAALLTANQYPVTDDAANAVANAATSVDVQLYPLTPTDNLTHSIVVTVAYPFAAPKGINLAAA
jgi:hypothetical protein